MWKTHYEKWLSGNSRMLTPDHNDDQVKIVIDTDIGSDVDDSWALGLALASPEVQVEVSRPVATTPLSRQKLQKHFFCWPGMEMSRSSAVPTHQLNRQMINHHGQGYGVVFLDFLPKAGFFRSSKKEMRHLNRHQISNKRQVRIEREIAVDALIRLFHKHKNLELVCIGPLTKRPWQSKKALLL